VFLLDGVLFARLLPWYKEHVRGPHLPFEHLDEELAGKAGWPPIGDCKNNEIKIGETDRARGYGTASSSGSCNGRNPKARKEKQNKRNWTGAHVKGVGNASH
jgi:hypothetical protein